MDLRNQFLLAMPGLTGSHFQQSLILMCEHTPDGATGLIVNQPLGLTLGEILQHLDITASEGAAIEQPIHYGGPVEPERGFILHTPTAAWDGAMAIGEQIALSSSRSALEAMGDAQGPSRTLLTLGYAGWGPGQLESEIADNAWLTCPADAAIVFERPVHERLAAAAARLGIDLSQLSGDAGHA